MKVCWFGIYQSDYSRNQVLMSGLRLQGVEIIECNTINETGIKKYWSLIKKLRLIKGEYDLIFCAFPINYSVIIAKLFQRKKVVIDAFFPIYDAYVYDRKLLAPWSPLAIIYFLLDWLNIRLADLVITDTEQHAQYWKKIYPGVPVGVIPVGSYTKEFFPIVSKNVKKDFFLVSFHGSYIPLQGVDKIVAAIDLINKQNINIYFRLIGPARMFDDLGLRNKDKYLNVELVPWLKTEDLNVKLNEADVILGIFGDTAKTDRVVPNKLFQGIAVKKAVITKDTLAVRELFINDEVSLVDNSPEALASEIISLYHDRERAEMLGELGYSKYCACFTEREIGKNVHNYLRSLVNM